jgi:hypothetical protein
MFSKTYSQFGSNRVQLLLRSGRCLGHLPDLCRRQRLPEILGYLLPTAPFGLKTKCELKRIWEIRNKVAHFGAKRTEREEKQEKDSKRMGAASAIDRLTDEDFQLGHRPGGVSKCE